MRSWNDDCPSCGEKATSCRMTPIKYGFHCCTQCRDNQWHARQVIELPSEDGPGEPLTQEEEDRAVEVMLALARGTLPSSLRGTLARVPVAAYRNLAESRGVDLEVALRHACRDDLKAIVRMPSVEVRATSHDHRRAT